MYLFSYLKGWYQEMITFVSHIYLQLSSTHRSEQRCYMNNKNNNKNIIVMKNTGKAFGNSKICTGELWLRSQIDEKVKILPKNVKNYILHSFLSTNIN